MAIGPGDESLLTETMDRSSSSRTHSRILAGWKSTALSPNDLDGFSVRRFLQQLLLMLLVGVGRL